MSECHEGLHRDGRHREKGSHMQTTLILAIAAMALIGPLAGMSLGRPPQQFEFSESVVSGP